MGIRIRRIMKVATAVAVVAALAVPAQAAGDVSSAPKRRSKDTKCGGKWDAAATCTFRYAGGGLELGGSFKAETAGYVTVVLEAEGPVEGVKVPVLECSTPGFSFGGCVSFATDSPTVELEKGQVLTCSVQGSELGRFRCSSSST